MIDDRLPEAATGGRRQRATSGDDDRRRPMIDGGEGGRNQGKNIDGQIDT